MKFLLLLLTALSVACCHAANITRDIEYASIDGRSLKLDLYLPPEGTATQSPLLVYVHGGAWRAGDKSEMPLGKLVTQGFPVASVDYRLSTEARFPAQAFDIKAAIRFLRAEGKKFHVDASRIVIVGGSAGGHLAALIGVTNGVKELEGTLGEHRAESSAVQGIISLYGASNLQTILAQSTPHGLSVRVPALDLLLGAQPDKVPDLAQLGSPVAHVDPTDPPLLLIHGDEDPQMPYQQSEELLHAYEAVKRPAHLETIPHGKHGGKEFYDDTRIALMSDFLRHLGKD